MTSFLKAAHKTAQVTGCPAECGGAWETHAGVSRDKVQLRKL